MSIRTCIKNANDAHDPNNKPGPPLASIGQAAKHNKFLWGNFAPVDGDFYSQTLPVTEGSIPPELEGLFARNGEKGPSMIDRFGWLVG
jgi:carotenoid cleavage dioxygenase-like enzyme